MCFKNRPHADIVSSTLFSGEGFFRGVRGNTDAHGCPHQGPDIGQRNVLLPHMHAVCVADHGQINVIVHHEAGMVLLRHAPQDTAFFKFGPVFKILFPVLQNADTGSQEGFGNLLHAASEGKLRISQSV